MLFLTVLAMAFLLGITYFARKDLLFPPVLFNAVWLLSLGGILLSGDMFYSISFKTYFVYIIGAISFSFGGILGLFMGGRRVTNREGYSLTATHRRYTNYAIDVLLLLLLVGLPFFWEKVSNIADDTSGALFLFTIRQKMTSPDEVVSLGLIGNLVVLAQLVAAVAYYEMDGSKIWYLRMVIATFLALVYGGITGVKGNAITLILTLFFISAIKHRKVRIRVILAVAGLSIFVFASGLIAINFAYASFDMMESAFTVVGETVLNYWLGALIAFNQIVADPNIIESSQPIYRFFLETARSLGMDVYVPFLHADFIMISDHMDTNTYTIYFTYFKDLGWMRMALIMVFLGASLTYLYQRALVGRPIAVLFFSMMCVSIVWSIVAEHFFLGLNYYIKAFVFFYLFYRGLPAIEPRWTLIGPNRV